MAILNITIKYQIIGYTQTVSSEGVVTDTSRVAFNPGDVSDDGNVSWSTVNIEVNPSDFNIENDGQQYIKLDDVFWSRFESIAQQQPADHNLFNLSPAWACKWSESSVQFFAGGSSEPAERLPLDGSAITAVVTEFVNDVPVGLIYKNAITGEQLGNQANDVLDFNLIDLNEWDMTGLPTGWYAASAKLDWGPKASDYTMPKMVAIPSFFNFAGNFETNTHIPRCMVNTEYSITVGDTTVSHFCRDVSTVQVMAALNFLHKTENSIPVITVTCHKTNTAPATCSANYTHDVINGDLLFTSPSANQLYLSKDHKVDNSTDLFGQWGSDCLTELKKLVSVSPASSVVKTAEAFSDSISATWTCNASYKVRATKLIVYLKGGVVIGGLSPHMIYDSTPYTVDIGTTKYTDLFTSSATIQVNNKNVRVFLQEIANMKPDAAQIVIPYEVAYGTTAQTIEASYSAKYSIRLKFISNVGVGDNGLKFYPETRDDKKLQYICKTVRREFTTDEDALTQSISELLNFDVQYNTIEGPDFIYCIGDDATLSENNVEPDENLADAMKPVCSVFHDAKEHGTTILNTSLSDCIDNNITEIVFEVTPQPPRAFSVTTHWQLVSKTGAVISVVFSKRLAWFTYANNNKTFADLCTFYKENNSINFTSYGQPIPHYQWAISSIANTGYDGDDKQEQVIPYESTTLSTLYIRCRKNLDYTTYDINRLDGNVLTISKDGSSVYRQASLKIPESKTTIDIANDLANQSLLPMLSGGAVIFLSNGQQPANDIFADWPGFTTMSGADRVYHNGKLCDQLLNVNQGIGMSCQYLKILDGSSGTQNIKSYLESSAYMVQSTVKRRFFIGLVGAGGGGGGGDLRWFDSNGGCGGGSGGYTLFICTIKNGVTDAEMKTLTIAWSGGEGGSNGERSFSGGNGSTATLTLSITRNGSSKTLAKFMANGGSGGGAYDSSGGSGAAAPIHDVADSSLISVGVVVKMDGISGERPKTGTETFEKTYTKHFNYFELDNSWIGYEISKALAPGGTIPTNGGVKRHWGRVYSKSTCDSRTSSIFTELNKAASSHYNVYQLFPGNFSCSGVYDDNKNGGPGAPSVVGPGSIFSEDGNYGYDRPCPGCGGCGSGHWVQGSLFSGDEDDEVPGRPGGNAMFAILC